MSALSMSQASIPAFEQMLASLLKVLEKGEAYATARKIDPSVLLSTRLFPDMFALTRQVQITCDFAKNTAGRLAGVELPKFADEEKTFEELKARIAKTLDFIHSLDTKAIDASAHRDIAFKLGPRDISLRGDVYLLQFALPNFYFHHSMTYAILRHCGVEIGKMDYMGKVPGFPTF